MARKAKRKKKKEKEKYVKLNSFFITINTQQQ